MIQERSTPGYLSAAPRSDKRLLPQQHENTRRVQKEAIQILHYFGSHIESFGTEELYFVRVDMLTFIR